MKHLISFFFVCLFLHAQTQPTIPAVMEQRTAVSTIRIKELRSISWDQDELRGEALTFNVFLRNAKLPEMELAETAEKNIRLVYDAGLAEEEYRMQPVGKSLEIRGRKSGVFYGLMTLLQWMSQDAGTSPVFHSSIHDKPVFSWRGMHLDVCRHFFPTGFIKKYIDILAMHKMNTFHWHLTDDQGWRIEIKKYPKLTSVGSKRKETMVDKNFDPYLGDRTPVEGYYTQAQVEDIIKYAQLRHVTIVPEIEMPGHAQAALAAYPEFSCSGEPVEVMTTWGVSEKVFCSKDNTIQFLQDVLDEVMALFPSKYIHIGGDEVPRASWKACAYCQKNMKRNRLKDEHELQSYFIRQIDAYVNSKGRSIIGWDEILEGGLAENAAVMSWRGEEGGIAAAKQQHNVVMSPGSHCYFDHYQSNPRTEPLAIGGYTPIDKVYRYNPIPASLKEKDANYILGAQGNVWTEYMQVSSQVEYMAVPRISALSEVLWLGEKRPGFDDFKLRLRTHFPVLKRSGIHYATSVFDVMADTSRIGSMMKVVLRDHYDGGDIYFTTDGSEPGMTSKKYNAATPLQFDKPMVLKARYFENNEALGKTLVLDVLK